MKAQKTKLYTLNQVGDALKITGRCVRNYVKAGLIHLTPWPTYPMTITEDELKRIKREGIDNTDIYAKLAKLPKSKRAAAGTAAKKKQSKKRAAAATAAAKPTKKKSAGRKAAVAVKKTVAKKKTAKRVK